jgi:ketohexokinase
VLAQLLAPHPSQPSPASSSASAADLSLHLVSVLPAADSPATQQILSSFGADGRVSLAHTFFRTGHAAAASSFIVRSAATGSRTIVNYQGLAEMTEEEFAVVVEAFAGARETWWHFEARLAPFRFLCVSHGEEISGILRERN